MQCMGYLLACPWQFSLQYPGVPSNVTTASPLEQRENVMMEWPSAWLASSRTVSSFPKWGSVVLEKSYGRVARRMKTEKCFAAIVPQTGEFRFFQYILLISSSLSRCNQSKETAEMSAAGSLESGTTKLDIGFLILILVVPYVLSMSLYSIWTRLSF